LGHTSKFQRVSRLGSVTAATSLAGGQPNFARCLAVSWADTPYIHFGGSCALTEFCPVQNSLCVRVLRSPTLAALLHGTPAAGVNETLRRGTSNGTAELSQRAPPIFGWAAITLGIGPHSSCTTSCTTQSTTNLYNHRKLYTTSPQHSTTNRQSTTNPQLIGQVEFGRNYATNSIAV